MEFFPRDAIINEMNKSLSSILHQYNLEDVGVFEEEGEGNSYYLGYTIRKNNEVYMIHQQFTKNDQGELTVTNNEWIIESDDGDTRGYQSLEDVFHYIDEEMHH